MIRRITFFISLWVLVNLQSFLQASEHPGPTKKSRTDDGKGTFILDKQEVEKRYVQFEQSFELGKVLGEGVFGRVYQLTEKKTGREFALKVIKTESLTDSEPETKILKELQTKRLSTEEDDEFSTQGKNHIVGFVDDYKLIKKQKPLLIHEFILMERLHVDLSHFLDNHRTSTHGLPLECVAAVGKQLLCALSFLAKRGVIHCDLKPANVLMVKGSLNEDFSDIQVKISDFGLARKKSETDRYDVIQTMIYRAPERLFLLPYHEGVDIWSLGCSLCELYTGSFLIEPSKQGTERPLPEDDYHEEDQNTRLNHLREIRIVIGSFPDSMISPQSLKFKQDLISHKVLDTRVAKSFQEMQTLSRKRLTNQIKRAYHSHGQGDEKSAEGFTELLQGLLTIDMEMRLTAHQALSDPFFVGK